MSKMERRIGILILLVGPLAWLMTQWNSIMVISGMGGFLLWLIAWPIAQAFVPIPKIGNAIAYSVAAVFAASAGTMAGMEDAPLDEMDAMYYFLIPLLAGVSALAGFIVSIVRAVRLRRQAREKIQGFPVQPIR